MTQPASPVTRLTTNTRTNLNGILKGDGTSLGTVTVGANLSYDGTTLSATGGGTPGGSSGQVQYNSAGSFAGSANLTFDGTTLVAGGISRPPATNSEAFGAGASCSGIESVALGASAASQAASPTGRAVVIGYNATLTGTGTGDSVVVGWGAAGSGGRFQTAVGASTVCSTSDKCTALGYAAQSTGGNSVALGTNALATALNALALGSQCQATASGAVAMGTNGLSANTGEMNFHGNVVDPAFVLSRYSDTTGNRSLSALRVTWATSTDASRKARATWTVYDTAEREGIRLEASGSAAMLGLYGTAATIQYATTGTVLGYTGGGGTALTHSDTFTGNTGATAYTIGDVVRCLKLLGAMAA